MTPDRLYRDDLAEVWHADSLNAEHVEEIMGSRRADLLCVDAPYSEKTQSGHNTQQKVREGTRRALPYGHWSPTDVSAFCGLWLPRVSGWCVSLTDDTLFSSWRAELERADMVTFQDVACVVTGMTVRLCGDGPSSWTIHAAVGRRRSKELALWGTLDGAYVGTSERQEHVGGKPLWLMCRLLSDYSRPGSLTVDPCCGAATTGLAALRTGRRFIGCDKTRETAELAAEIIRAERSNSTRRLMLSGQTALFGSKESA